MIHRGQRLDSPRRTRIGRTTDPSLQTSRVRCQIECPSGSIFVMDGRVWHQTGINKTREQTRAGVRLSRAAFHPTALELVHDDKVRVTAKMGPLMQEMLGP